MSVAQPLSVYARVRPYRVAFCIDPEHCPPELIDGIIGTSLRLWGGRCHPIIPVQGGAIPEPYWRLLAFTDPDLVYTYVNLPPPLLARLDREICPLEVRAHPPQALAESPPFYRPYNVATGGIGCIAWLPALVERERLITPVKVVVSRAHGDWAARRFVLRNFGILDETAVLWQYLHERDAIFIDARQTEGDVLSAVSRMSARFIFPHNVAAHWSDLDEPEHASQEYAIVLGSDTDLWAALFAWNRIAHVAAHLREQWHTMVLHPDRLRDGAFAASVNAFLNSHVLRYGSTQPVVEVWYSTPSVASEDQARALTQDVFDRIDCVPVFKQLVAGEYPPVERREDRFYAFERTGPFQRHRSPVFQFQAPAHSFLVHIPTNASGSIAAGALDSAMLDLKIEYQPDHPPYLGTRFWWRLPKVLGITHAFGRIGRVATDGILSFKIEGEAAVEVTVPHPLIPLHHVLSGGRHPAYTGDLRPITPPPFYGLRDSDKGRYNRGIGALFGDITIAGRFYQHLYWRQLLELLSGWSPERDTRSIESVKRSLRQDRAVIERAGTGDEVAIEQLTRTIMELARQQQLRDREIRFEELLTRLIQQRAAFVRENPGLRFTVKKRECRSDLLDAMQDLTGMEILLQGASIVCEHCGSTFWYGAGAIAPQMRCEGCRATVPLPTEVEWSYRLNALVRNGIALYGAGPVLSTLADLSLEARTFFIADPGVDLFERGKGEPTAELDLAGIIDGQVFIGEVKTDTSGFEERDLHRLADTARRVSAHLVILAAFLGERTLLATHAQVLGGLLGDAGVEVRTLMPHDWCFRHQFHLSY